MQEGEGFYVVLNDGSEMRTTCQDYKTSKCFLIALEINLQIRGSLVFLYLLCIFCCVFFVCLFLSQCLQQPWLAKESVLWHAVWKSCEKDKSKSGPLKKKTTALSGACSLRVSLRAKSLLGFEAEMHTTSHRGFNQSKPQDTGFHKKATYQDHVFKTSLVFLLDLQKTQYQTAQAKILAITS